MADSALLKRPESRPRMCPTPPSPRGGGSDAEGGLGRPGPTTSTCAMTTPASQSCWLPASASASARRSTPGLIVTPVGAGGDAGRGASLVRAARHPTDRAVGRDRRVDDHQTIRFGSVRHSTPEGRQGTEGGWWATSWSSSARTPSGRGHGRQGGGAPRLTRRSAVRSQGILLSVDVEISCPLARNSRCPLTRSSGNLVHDGAKRPYRS